MTEGVIAWLNNKWGFGVIVVGERFVTFPDWEIQGTVRQHQRVAFDLDARKRGGFASNIVPLDEMADPDDQPRCPRCGNTPVDEGVRVHKKRWSRTAEIHVTITCYRCPWGQPEQLATMVEV